MTETGRVLAVYSVPLGSALTADALTGSTTLNVFDAADFIEDGGQLVINGEVIEYSDVDDELGIITLVTTISADAFADDSVRVWDIALGAEAKDVIAEVTLDGDDGFNDDAMEAYVSHSLIPFLPEGIREFEGEYVGLEWRGGDLWVVEVNSQTPIITGSLFRTAVDGNRVEIKPRIDDDQQGSAIDFYSGHSDEITEGFVLGGWQADGQAVTWPELRFGPAFFTNGRSPVIVMAGSDVDATTYGSAVRHVADEHHFKPRWTGGPTTDTKGVRLEMPLLQDLAPYVDRYRTSNLLIANNTEEMVPFNTLRSEQAITNSGGKEFTIPQGWAGFYSINATVTWAAQAGGRRHAFFYVNGQRQQRAGIDGTGGAFLTTNISKVLWLSEGSVIYIAAWQNSGSAVDLVGSIENVNLDITYLYT